MSPRGVRPSAGAASVIDVARTAGVSLGTVSNVLNRPDKVAVATRQKVFDAIDELGFVRNEAARQLRSGASRIVGVVVPDIANPFFTDVASGVEAAAGAAGLSVVLCNSAGSSEREDRYLGLLQEQRAYGILLTPTGAHSRRAAAIHRAGTPIVFVDRRSPRTHCSVSVDDEAGGALAVRHLLDAGHRRIAFAGGPTATKQVADRLAGAQSAVAGSRANLSVVETTETTVAAGRAAGTKIAGMRRSSRPTAVFCANDLVALGVLQEMTARGLGVPHDLAIVGYDDIDFAAAAAVPLSSVRQPRAALGQTAAGLMVEEVTDKATHRHQQAVFQPELIVRRSSTGQD